MRAEHREADESYQFILGYLKFSKNAQGTLKLAEILCIVKKRSAESLRPPQDNCETTECSHRC